MQLGVLKFGMIEVCVYLNLFLFIYFTGTRIPPWDWSRIREDYWKYPTQM